MKPNKGQMKRQPPSKNKMTAVKRGIRVKGSWKTVDLDPSMFAEDGMKDLVCFEELTDYRLVDSDKASKGIVEGEKEKKKPKKKAKKRKATDLEGNGAVEEAGGEEAVKTETSETPPVKKRKKKKKKGSRDEPTKPESSAGDNKESKAKQPGQTPEHASETVTGKNTGEKDVSEESVPQDLGVQKEAETQPATTKKKKKKRKKKKNMAGTQTVLGQRDEQKCQSQTKKEPSSGDKPVKVPKKKAKNWTNTSVDQNSDVSAWKDLFVPAPVLKALSSLGFGSPTAIQALALPPAIRDHMDIVGAAETGSGKTLSFAIPMIHTILEWKNSSDEAEGQTKAAPAQVESLYLPSAEGAEDGHVTPDNSEKSETQTVVSVVTSVASPVVPCPKETNETGLERNQDETEQEVSNDQEEKKDEMEQESKQKEEEERKDETQQESKVEKEEESKEKEVQSKDGTQQESKEKEEQEERKDTTEQEIKEKEQEESKDEIEPDPLVAYPDSDNEVDGDVEGGNASDDDEDIEEEDGDDQRMGCVKVIEDVDFNFGSEAEEEEVQMYGSQPLLGLVLTPTRELAVQVKHHIDAVAKFTAISSALVVGGMAQQKQERMLKRRPEIIIATPGRLWELIKERHPHLLNLRQIRCLVIDEADRMIEKGHFAELENILEMLNTVQFNPKRQTFVFSATLTMARTLPTRVLQKKGKNADQRTKLELLMEKTGIRTKPKVIDLTRKEATVETLTETRIHCEKDEKDFFLYYFLLQYPGRTMVFANSIDCIKRLNSLLVILDVTPLPLHANMHQKQRLKNLERFAERDSCVLLTTDVAARGLDIPNVQHVIHYQVPRTSETYVHRSGRTARATKEGLSLLLIGPDDMMNYKKIYRALGKDEDLPMFPIQSKCMAAIKERVNMARKIEKIEYYNSREKQHNSWFQQAAEALEVDLDEDLLLGGRKDEEDERQQQRMVKGMKNHLKHMLSLPVFKNDMKTKYPTQMGKLALPEMPRAGVETAITSVAKQKEKRKIKKQKQKLKKKMEQEQ